MTKKPCKAQVETTDGQTYTCDKPAHLTPVHTDGDVKMIGVPGLPVLVSIPRK